MALRAVRSINPDSPTARQDRAAVQTMSLATTPADAPGNAVRREKVRPPSAVASTLPSVSNR